MWAIFYLFGENYFKKDTIPWHLGGSVIMLCFVLIAVILTPAYVFILYHGYLSFCSFYTS